MRSCIHFVGFRDDRYWNAVRVWGRPDFFHYNWDRRADREVLAGDTVIFATGDSNKPKNKYSGNDIFEEVS